MDKPLVLSLHSKSRRDPSLQSANRGQQADLHAAAPLLEGLDKDVERGRGQRADLALCLRLQVARPLPAAQVLVVDRELRVRRFVQSVCSLLC